MRGLDWTRDQLLNTDSNNRLVWKLFWEIKFVHLLRILWKKSKKTATLYVYTRKRKWHLYWESENVKSTYAYESILLVCILTPPCSSTYIIHKIPASLEAHRNLSEFVKFLTSEFYKTLLLKFNKQFKNLNLKQKPSLLYILHSLFTWYIITITLLPTIYLSFFC